MIIAVIGVHRLLLSIYSNIFDKNILEGKVESEEADTLLEHIEKVSYVDISFSNPDINTVESTPMASWGNQPYRPKGRGRGRATNFQSYHQPKSPNGVGSASLPTQNNVRQHDSRAMQSNHSYTTYGSDQQGPVVTQSGYLPPRMQGEGDRHGQRAGVSTASSATPAYPQLLVYDELYELERLWQSKNNQATITRFKNFMSNTSTPYSDVLRLLESCSDVNEVKSTTLACAMAREFCQWIKHHHPLCEHLTEELQMKAFVIATRNEKVVIGQFLDYIATAYNLKSANYLGLSFAKKLLAKSKLKEAATLINCLQLHSHFDLYQCLIIPLLLQDKLNVVETLVRDSRGEQTKLVGFFDKVSQRNFDLSSIIPDNVQNIAIRFNHRTMLKHGTRLMKKYDIPSDQCPNLARSQGMAFIRHLLHKYYQDQSLAHDNWAELTRSALSDDVHAHADFVNLLASYDLPEAHRWYKDLDIPASELTPDIVHYTEEDSIAPRQDMSSTLENWDDECTGTSPEYYKLKLPLDRVHMVSTSEQFHIAVNDLIKAESGWIGVDAEWKPVFSATAVTRLAILQLSTWTDAYLLDVIALNAIPELDWSILVDGIFMNGDLLKLGYGFSADIRLLRKAIAIWGDRNIVNMLDICNVQHAVCEAKDIVPTSQSDKGLSEAVRLFLGGQTLDKGEQMSDWERRPLRQSQLIYASLDAFCLLELWKILEKMADQLNLYICAETYKKVPSTSSKKSKAKGKKKKGKTALSGPEIFGDSSQLAAENSVKSIRFVVSNMLQGLGKQLRLLGVDVHIIDDERGDDHDDAARICHTENRIILTAGKPYARLSALTSPGKCFCIDTELSARQQALAVLKHFNIHVSAENIFSRCQTCNNDIYIIMDKFIMGEMFRRYVTRPAPSPEDWAKLKPSEGYSQSDMTLGNGIHLQLEPVSEKILYNVDAFFCCALCGKVFWEGSHYDRVHENFANVLSLKTKPIGRPV